jgi:hypothetical protein
VCISWTNKEFDIINARCNHEDLLYNIYSYCSEISYFYGKLFNYLQYMQRNSLTVIRYLTDAPRDNEL